MATICVFCGKAVSADRWEPFVPNRIWGLAHKWTEHEHDHQSVFAEGQEDSYSSFLINRDDKAANLVAKYGFSRWKNKVVFHYLVSGSESKEEFKRLLKELLEEIDSILQSELPSKEDKIRLLVVDKFEPYREIIKRSVGESEAKKKWSPTAT